MSRSFTIESVHRANGTKVRFSGGRYLGNTPDQVVRKMFSKARGSDKSLTIVFRETTQGSLKKEFKKKVTKVHDPVTIQKGGELITFEYTTKVKSLAL